MNRDEKKRFSRTCGVSAVTHYRKMKRNRMVTFSEMEKYIKHDKFNQKVLRDFHQHEAFWEGVREGLRMQYGNTSYIFDGSYRAAEEAGDFKRAAQIRAQIELSSARKKPLNILGNKEND